MFQSLMASEGRAEEKYRESMFGIVNPTFGTGIATTDAATAYDVTTPALLIFNNDTNDRQTILLDQCELRVTAVNTSATSFHLGFTKRSGNTYTSGGTDFTSSIVNMGGNAENLITAQRASIAKVYFGVLVAAAAAATTDRIIWRQQVRDVIFAADDTLSLLWGEGITGTHGATTSATSKNVRLPPMWVQPGESLQIHFISPSQGADPAFEIALNWIERPGP